MDKYPGLNGWVHNEVLEILVVQQWLGVILEAKVTQIPNLWEGQVSTNQTIL